MKKVISTYNINSKTMALLPAKEIGYDTIVIEEDEIKYVQQTSFNLIREAFINDAYTTYEGTRKAMIIHTQFIQRTPMPINICTGNYFFPTHSPGHIDNIWIAFHHVLSIGKVPPKERTEQAQSIVHFKNGQSLKLSISYHTLEEQCNRTKYCQLLIEKNKSFK